MLKNKLGVLVGFLGMTVLVSISALAMGSTPRLEPELPIVMVEVTVQNEQRDAFFEKIKEFSKKNAFAIRIAPTFPASHKYLIQLWREDVNITGTNPFEPGVYRIGFYKNGPYDIPPEVLEYLISELENVVRELPSVKFSIMSGE